MSAYQQAMLQALGIQQYTSLESSVVEQNSTLEADAQQTDTQQTSTPVHYPDIPDTLVHDIRIALNIDVTVSYGKTLSLTPEMVTLPYPFTHTDKPLLFKALYAQSGT